MRARSLTAGLLALVVASPLAQAQEVALEELAPELRGNAYFSPYEDLDEKVLAVLDMAEPGSTVYMSYYSLSYYRYPQKFKELRDRGVTVKLNLFEGEAQGYKRDMVDDMHEEGSADVALIPNLRNRRGYGSLHTKFTVVNDRTVVTGSANLSASASLANHEHVIVLENPDLAAQYLVEWEEQRTAAQAMHEAMSPDEWRTFYRNPYGRSESNNYGYPEDWFEGRDVEVKAALRAIDKKVENPLSTVKTYFSPEDEADRRVVEVIDEAESTVEVAMYSFVNHSIAYALRRAAQRGCQVTVIADNHQQQIEYAQPINELLEAEENIRYLRVDNHLGKYSSLHHKYAIVDDEVVIGGSYNWTANATDSNDENMVVVRSARLAQRFNVDFEALLQKYEDPVAETMARLDEDQDGAVDAEESADEPSVRWADADGDGAVSAEELGAFRAARRPTIEGETTRVLFCVRYPYMNGAERLPSGYELVIVGDTPGLGDGDATKGLVLRGSRSTAPRLLGSADLPRGEEVRWKVVLLKRGSITSVIEGENAFSEEGEERALAVDDQGVPMIVEERWRGSDPVGD